MSNKSDKRHVPDNLILFKLTNVLECLESYQEKAGFNNIDSAIAESELAELIDIFKERVEEFYDRIKKEKAARGEA